MKDIVLVLLLLIGASYLFFTSKYTDDLGKIKDGNTTCYLYYGYGISCVKD